MIQVWIFDGSGYFVESEIIKKEEITSNMTNVPLLAGFVKAKWDGTEWVEGATPEEIAVWQEKNNAVAEPTIEGKLQAQIDTMQGALDFIILNY